jgi:hypothetical protein
MGDRITRLHEGQLPSMSPHQRPKRKGWRKKKKKKKECSARVVQEFFSGASK